MTPTWRRAALAAAASLTLVAAAACGGDDSGSSETAAPDTNAPGTSVPDTGVPDVGGFPVEVAGATGSVTLEERPERVVVLSPTHTEIIFAIGAGDQVVAIDDQSTYPPEAQSTPNDLSGFQPNLEAIAAYEPDVVVIGDDFTGLTDQLQPLGIPVWSGATAVTFDDVYTQIEQLGALTGNVAEAAVLVGQMQTDIAELVASIDPADPPLTYYHELDDTLFSVTSRTFIGEVYALFGLENIADPAGDTTDYPQLSAEFIVEEGPDLIFLACTIYCGTTADNVGDRPGWDGIPAVVNGAVVELNDDIVSRWGPRVVDFVRTVSDALANIEVSAG